MTEGRLKPRFRVLADERNLSMSAISRRSGMTYQSVRTYYHNGSELLRLQLSTLHAYLRGLGMSDDEILAMPLGELFDIDPTAG